MIAEAVFGVFALLTLVSAVMVLRTQELVHAAVWLATLLLGVAGLFLSLGAEFLAIIQVLVYIGAVVTLILFTVMLTIPEERIDFLDTYDLPPGVTIESVQDLHTAQPWFTGAGPMIHLKETNPRLPTIEPDNLYGVSLADDEFASAASKKKQKKEGEE